MSAPTEHSAPTTTSGAAVDTTQRQDTGAEPVAPTSAAAPHETTPSGSTTTANTTASTTADASSADSTASTAPDEGYPEQMHAGKLDRGPNAPSGGGIADRLKATEEIIKGKLKHDPELVQQGEERRSGVLAEKRRQYDAEHDTGAFSKPDDGEKPTQAKGEQAAEEVRESGHKASADAATAGTKSA